METIHITNAASSFKMLGQAAFSYCLFVGLLPSVLSSVHKKHVGLGRLAQPFEAHSVYSSEVAPGLLLLYVLSVL